jgi:hypothetical protein
MPVRRRRGAYGDLSPLLLAAIRGTARVSASPDRRLGESRDEITLK